MKKFTTILLILMTLVFSTFIATPAFAQNVFKEGIYRLSDFIPAKDNSYFAQNISSEGSDYLIVVDEKLSVLQVIRLDPKSPKYNLVPLKPEYRVVIFGDGQLFIKGTQ